MLSVKQGNIKYHIFESLAWNWTPISWQTRSIENIVVWLLYGGMQVTTLIYKNINSLLYYYKSHEGCVCVWERESDCYDWHHVRIDIFRALLLCTSFMGDTQGLPATSWHLKWHDLSTLLITLPNWGWKLPSLYIIYSYIHMLKKKIKQLWYQQSFHQMMTSMSFWGQSIITTNPECSPVFYNTTRLCWFSIISWNEEELSLCNPFLYSQLFS